jgi:hypothetical protein
MPKFPKPELEEQYQDQRWGRGAALLELSATEEGLKNADLAPTAIARIMAIMREEFLLQAFAYAEQHQSCSTPFLHLAENGSRLPLQRAADIKGLRSQEMLDRAREWHTEDVERAILVATACQREHLEDLPKLQQLLNGQVTLQEIHVSQSEFTGWEDAQRRCAQQKMIDDCRELSHFHALQASLGNRQ